MQDELRVVPGTDCQLVLCGIEDIKKQVALPGAVWREREVQNPPIAKKSNFALFS